MLVLTRRPGERVVIGRSITVTVAEIEGDRVRLVFEAPSDVPIYRAEVHERCMHQPECEPAHAHAESEFFPYCA